ncbi:MAG: acetate/propionate family kinase [Halanaerobiaceae bacterium]
MKILVLNSGSSSIKFKVFNLEDQYVMASGTVDRIGIDNSFLDYEYGENKEKRIDIDIPDHARGIKLVLDTLQDDKIGVIETLNDLNAVGHRVVHGGEKFAESTLINQEVVEGIEEVSHLAPLHNPHNINGIKVCTELMPGKPQVAVFDTAFHQTMKKNVYLYALPWKYYTQHGIRRYGFHGTSHKFVAQKAAEVRKKPFSSQKIITCHLGNGASVAAIDQGKSVETSMGLTPLEGLIMGTRCGDLDPGLITFIMEKENLSIEEVNDIMNKESGLLGISGLSSDSRDVRKAAAQGHKRAQLALKLFNYQVVKYIGAYTAVMNGLDMIVFTAGIGENACDLRADIVNALDFLQVELDDKANQVRQEIGRITTDQSQVDVYVIPTDEELVIAQDTQRVVEKCQEIGVI